MPDPASIPEFLLKALRCPVSGLPLDRRGDLLVSQDGNHTYRLSPSGIPLFAETFISQAGRTQKEHYDAIAASYIASLDYAHTQEYTAYLDRALFSLIGDQDLGLAAEICCGRAEAIQMLGGRIQQAIGIDISESMLSAALDNVDRTRILLVQGDAVHCPLADESCDTVVMLGGIHHVQDRLGLFSEIRRILKPGGTFFWREPVSDFFLWRFIRAIIYRLSPQLDHETERPLLYDETAPFLAQAGLELEEWRTVGLFGFCLFMNSDVLVFNRLFRFLPGIRWIVRMSARLDDFLTRSKPLARSGLIVVGRARKPSDRAVGGEMTVERQPAP